MTVLTLEEFARRYLSQMREEWLHYLYWGVTSRDDVFDSAVVRGFIHGLVGDPPPGGYGTSACRASVVDPDVGPDAMRWTPEMADQEMAEWRKLLDA